MEVFDGPALDIGLSAALCGALNNGGGGRIFIEIGLSLGEYHIGQEATILRYMDFVFGLFSRLVFSFLDLFAEVISTIIFLVYRVV
jgi:hypothetical protein